MLEVVSVVLLAKDWYRCPCFLALWRGTTGDESGDHHKYYYIPSGAVCVKVLIDYKHRNKTEVVGTILIVWTKSVLCTAAGREVRDLRQVMLMLRYQNMGKSRLHPVLVLTGRI